MQIAVRINNADIEEAVRTYVERRLRFALARYGGRVGQVSVQVTIEKHGEKRCRISVEVLPFGRLAVEEKHRDLFAAIDRATGRVGWLFGRERQRNRRVRGRESIRYAA